MTCGCERDQDSRSRAARCEVCPAAGRAAGLTVRRTAVRCTVSGNETAQHFAGFVPCPLRKWGEDGVQRWLGIDWYGVPYPIRLWLWLFHAKHPKPGSFPGCGCIKRLKDLVRSVGGTMKPAG